VEEPLLAALRGLLEKRPDEAIDRLRRYDPLNQDMLLGLLALSVRLTQGSLDRASPQDVLNVLEQLNSLTVMLRPRAALAVERACFCRDITKFGDYIPLPEDHQFQAGRDGRCGERVLVYIELQNFASCPQGPFHETRLDARLEVRDRSGRRVWLQDFPAERPDRSYTLRHDYFIALRFLVPADVPPGTYVLGIEVKDVTDRLDRRALEHRVARRSLPFRVVAPGTPQHTSARPAQE
jgi:hypothetical protein